MASPGYTKTDAFNILYYNGGAIKDEDILTSMSKNLNSFRADQVHKSLKKEVLFKLFMFSRE